MHVFLIVDIRSSCEIPKSISTPTSDTGNNNGNNDDDGEDDENDNAGNKKKAQKKGSPKKKGKKGKKGKNKASGNNNNTNAGNSNNNATGGNNDAGPGQTSEPLTREGDLHQHLANQAAINARRSSGFDPDESLRKTIAAAGEDDDRDPVLWDNFDTDDGATTGMFEFPAVFPPK
jgi:hypothetical protein